MTNIYKKASIYNLNKMFICDTEVIGKQDDIIILIIPENLAPKLPTDLIITLYDDIYGLITYKAKIIQFKRRVSKNSQFEYMVKFKLIKKIGIVQRRSNVKVKTEIKTIIEFTDENWYKLINEDTKEPIRYTVVIKDISAAGILFKTKEKFDIGQYFIFTFNKCSKPFEVKAEILRIQKYDNEYFGYGCRFINLTLSKESIIRQYVFRMQIISKKNFSDNFLNIND